MPAPVHGCAMALLFDPFEVKRCGIADALTAIESSAASRSERKFLRRRVVEAAASGGPTNCDGGVLLMFEQLMGSVRACAGKQVGLAAIRRSLLEAGRTDLVRRVQALTVARRLVAHPDVALIKEVSEVFREFGTCGANRVASCRPAVPHSVGGGSATNSCDGDKLSLFYIGDVFADLGVQTDVSHCNRLQLCVACGGAQGDRVMGTASATVGFDNVAVAREDSEESVECKDEADIVVVPCGVEDEVLSVAAGLEVCGAVGGGSPSCCCLLGEVAAACAACVDGVPVEQVISTKKRKNGEAKRRRRRKAEEERRLMEAEGMTEKNVCEMCPSEDEAVECDVGGDMVSWRGPVLEKLLCDFERRIDFEAERHCGLFEPYYYQGKGGGPGRKVRCRRNALSRHRRGIVCDL